jgi:hypothetical protein
MWQHGRLWVTQYDGVGLWPAPFVLAAETSDMVGQIKRQISRGSSWGDV